MATSATKTPPTPGPKPTYQVVETNLHYTTNSGKELVLNLDIPFKVLRKVTAETDDETDQFLAMAEMMGVEGLLEQFESMGSIEVLRLITLFFTEFQKLAGMSVGEAQRSSDS